MRLDAGTENIYIEDIQKSFRWYHDDDMCGEKSVIIGRSMSNQVLLDSVTYDVKKITKSNKFNLFLHVH